MGANYSQEQMLGPRPHLAYCIKCKEARLTKVEYEDNPNRWNVCICLTFFWMFCTFWISVFVFISEGFNIIKAMAPMVMVGFSLGMLFVPICILLFFYKNIKHYCTHCEAYIGKFNPYNRQGNMMYYR